MNKLKLIPDLFAVLVVLVLFFLLSCNPTKYLTVPQEPTIWIVSEIYEPEKPIKQFNGLIGYKFIPVNPGAINAKSTWKLDYKGKYYIGQRLDFTPIPADAAGSDK